MSEQSFGSRLKELRESRGLSQAQLAERAGLHRFGVAKIEQGLREPSWSTLMALCRALGVSCAVFENATMGPVDPQEAPRRGRPRKAPSVAAGASSAATAVEPAVEPKADGRAKTRQGKGKAQK